MASAPTESEESSRAEQSVQAFRDALEKSITISRDRLQEVVDDAVRRGRMTRGDAEEMVGRLATRSREQAEDLLSQLDGLLSQVREVPDRAKQQAGERRSRPGSERSPRWTSHSRAPIASAVRPAPRASRSRRTTSSPSGRSIAGCRSSAGRSCGRVRDYERKNKARKSLLRALDRKLQP